MARGWPSVLGTCVGGSIAGALSAIPMVAGGGAKTWPLLLVGGAMVGVATSLLALAGHMLAMLRCGPFDRQSERSLGIIAGVVGFLAAAISLAVAYAMSGSNALACAGMAIAGPLLGTLAGWWLLIVAERHGHLRRFRLDRQCRACGYELEGVLTDRCPECGTLQSEHQRKSRPPRSESIRPPAGSPPIS